jgi:Ribosomal protein L11 methyltransferase (PrmA)
LYGLSDYLAMVDDPRRTSAYLAALRDTVRPGDHVLEIGTGFGFFAVHAALAGAAHVWAVEPNDAIALGPALAARHGVADRITFFQRRADQVALPRRADVLLEDLRGVFPLMGARASVLADVRARLLAPDARTIALRDHFVVAPCRGVGSSTERHTARGSMPTSTPEPTLDLAAVRARAARGWRRVAASALHPLADAGRWASVDLTAPIPNALHGGVEMIATAAGEIAGLGAWFEADLAGGHGFGSGPAHGPSVYDCAWFPLETALPVEPDDVVRIGMRATHDGSDYVWRWDVQVTSARHGETLRGEGTDLDAHLLSPERLARRASAAVPARSTAHDLLAALLARVDGHRPLGAIAAALREEYPQQLRSERDALDFVARELARITEGEAT